MGAGIALQAIAAIIVGFAVWKIAVWTIARAQRRGRPVPGPPRHWLLGNIPEVAAVVKSGRHFDAAVSELTREHGKLFSLDLVAHEFIIVLDPEALKEILVTKNYPKSPTYSTLFSFIGSESMIVSKHVAWQRQRKAYNPAFSYAFLRTLVPTVFADRGLALVRRLEHAVKTQETVKMLDILKTVTMDVIAQVALNKDYGFKDYGAKQPPIYRFFVDLLETTAFYASSKQDHPPVCSYGLCALAFFTLLFYCRPDLRYLRHLPWNKWRIGRMQSKFDNIILEAIRERIAANAAKNSAASSRQAGSSSIPPSSHPSTNGNSNGSGVTQAVARQASAKVAAASAAAAAGPVVAAEAAPAAGDELDNGWSFELEKAPSSALPEGMKGAEDILSMALQSSRLENDKLNENEVLSQIKSFLFAGHDTTSSLVAFSIYEISMHPDIEARIVAELKAEGCFDRAVDGKLTSDDLNALKYLGLVIKESLRLWPPAGTARMAPAGTTLQGYDIGLKVLYVPHFVIHRDKDLWGETAEEFRPERWTDAAYMAGVHPYAYQPFSKGPRDCIGQTFALLEAKSLLAMLFAHFTFRYMGTEPERQGYKITSFPMFHVPVTVTKRQ